MRDDIKIILKQILDFFKEKQINLKNLSQKEIDFFYLISDPLYTDYEDHFEETCEITEKIDELDYAIETSIDKISKICGIDREITLKKTLSNDPENFKQYKIILKENENLIKKITNQRNKNLNLINIKMKKYEESVISLSKLQNVKSKFGI